MIPLVGFPSELERMRTLILAELAEESLPIGTMIELPRACAVAGEIAGHADFFSFGTNDLTQMVCGISRDDAEEKFLAEYLRSGLLLENPFETLDQSGVGELVKMARERAARRTRTSSSVSAGNMAATRRASPSSTGRTSITCPARPSVYPARVSPPPKLY